MLEYVRKIVVAHQKKRWSKIAPGWQSGGASQLGKVFDAVINKVDQKPLVFADLGSGSGQLTLLLAEFAAKIYAVDISPQMLQILEDEAHKKGFSNIVTIAVAIEDVTFDPSSLDCVVSNYAFHHLLDSDKEAVTKKIYEWLKPGGSFVLGDMMFGRGATKRDRQIIYSKASAFLKRGPGGWFRILKNIWRFSLRLQERPISINRWLEIFKEAGFINVEFEPVVAEAVVMVGYKSDN
jgi:ubiquinone/menaquinone biosynthesis C-methylase UbiE